MPSHILTEQPLSPFTELPNTVVLHIFNVFLCVTFAVLPIVTVRSRVIDDTVGAVFDVQVIDIANDGHLQLLVSTNDEKNGSVFAYEIPTDFRTGNFHRHVLASGFQPREGGTGKGALGSAMPVKYIVPPYKRPFIVSGDDDGRAYLLLCTSYDWTYTLNPFLDVGKGTVGQISVDDVNEDYKLDVFIPAYDEGMIYVYQYNP